MSYEQLSKAKTQGSCLLSVPRAEILSTEGKEGRRQKEGQRSSDVSYMPAKDSTLHVEFSAGLSHSFGPMCHLSSLMRSARKTSQQTSSVNHTNYNQKTLRQECYELNTV